MNQKFNRMMLILLLPLLILPPLAYAHSGTKTNQIPQTITLTEGQGHYPLGLHMEILEDPSAELTLADVRSSAYDSHFNPSQTESPNFSYTNSAYWVRFRLNNQANSVKQWYLVVEHPDMNQVELFYPSNDKSSFSHKKTGSLFPFDTRDVDYRLITFDLPLATQSEQTIYARFAGKTTVSVGLTLYSAETFIKISLYDQFKLAFVIGFMVIMAFYNFFLFLSLRDKGYLYFVLFLVGITLYFLWSGGLFQQYIWRNSGQAVLYFIPISSLCVLTGMLKFSDTFLQLQSRSPRWHSVVTLALFLCVVMALIIPFNYALTLQLSSVVGLTGSVVIFGAGGLMWYRGYRPAYLFLGAWISMLVTTNILAFARIGLLPLNAFTMNGPQLGMMLLVLLLSFALADRINIFKHEKEMAQAESLQISQENERLIREQNIVLEQQVANRTLELSTANHHLEVAKEKAELANKAKSTFLATMSHELRTPLNGILGYAQVLSYDPQVTKKQTHGLMVIKQSGNHLLALINDVLDLAKVESGRIELYKTDFHVLFFLDSLKQIMQVRAKHKEITFQLEVSPDLPHGLQGDERRLRQVLLNL